MIIVDTRPSPETEQPPAAPLPQEQALAVFEQQRPRLLGLAYRILGSRADAEDVVQDCCLKWLGARDQAIDRPAAWLTTIVTRHAIDMLRAAQRSRVDYVGTWLPEPTASETPATIEDQMVMASSLSTAFLLLLERLSPKERAAFLLHEVFDQPHAQVAETLEVSEAASRKLVSRARSELGTRQARHLPSPERQTELLTAFRTAVRSGSPDALAGMLAEDVRMQGDGGGKAITFPGIVQGPDVLRFISRKFHRWWQGADWRLCPINGALGLLLLMEGRVYSALTFTFDDRHRIADIQIMRNPDKLNRIGSLPLQ